MMHAEVTFSVIKKSQNKQPKRQTPQNAPQTNKNKIATTIQQTAVPLPGQDLEDPLGEG